MEIGLAFRHPDDSTSQPEWFEEHDLIGELPRIDRTILQLAKQPVREQSLEANFANKRDLQKSTKHQRVWKLQEQSHLDQLRQIALSLMALERPHLKFSVYADSFLRHLRWCASGAYADPVLVLSNHDAAVFFDEVQSSTQALVDEINAPRFKRRAKEIKATAMQRTLSLQEWIKPMIQSSPRVLCIQLQLAYKKTTLIDIKTVLNDRKTFLDNRHKSPLFQQSKGYIAKLSNSPYKGFIIDMVLLYDVEHEDKRAEITRGLVTRWKESTDQRGIAWFEGNPIHSNAPRINGIWALDTPKDRQRFNQLTHYLSYYDTYLHYPLPRHTRTLVKSKPPT